ncbi:MULTISPECIES: hypothetical protein [Nocardiopsis]|uniref:hypothetical protein n=1 Tax=Nocardiopsis TaxID=2013 RepID=UPI00117EB2B7|nr:MULTISPECIES: hypothetical protein [Nocardiopsis]
MTPQPTYKNINAIVRPPRCAILINKQSEYWRAAVSGSIMQASGVWGGKNFLIIPTDGETIEEKFWELLEAYSPDHVVGYGITVADLKEADPKKHQDIKDSLKKQFQEGGYQQDFDEWLTRNVETKPLENRKISDKLQEDLLCRLSPFHHKNQIVSKQISRLSGFSYPFTRITEILPYAKRKVEHIVIPKELEDCTLNLLLHSQTGLGSFEYQKRVTQQGVSIEEVPEAYDTRNLLRNTFGDRLYSHIKKSSQWNLPDDYMAITPFGISMLHLAQYYRNDCHNPHEEPFVVILGDTVDDFCLYYSLSRLHDGVLWLPLADLRDCYSALNKRKKAQQQGEELSSLNDKQEITRTLVNLCFERVRYGHEDNRIQLRSMSLNRHQLISYRSQMARCIYTDVERFMSITDCVTNEHSSTECVARTFEENNYYNNYSVVFVDNKTVSPFPTPKPKNFSEIKLPDHYWLTSLQIEDYGPPSLPKLGPKILKGGTLLTTEARVATDGIVYNCPSPMHFGGDVDVNTVRPRIYIPNTMELLQEYFEGICTSIQLSDKGKYFQDTVRRFGDLNALGKFVTSSSGISILDKFLAKKNEKSEGVIYLDNDQRAYLSLGALTASLGNERQAANLIDDFMGKGIIERGYIFGCERCSLSSWYSLDALTAEFTCSRCSFQQKFTSQHWKHPVEPRWYYKLAETVYQFYQHNSDLPARVLYDFKQKSQTFHYSPEIELIGFPSPGEKKELDIACIADGKIIVGECKTQTMTKKDVARFELLTKSIKKLPDEILFVSTCEIPDRLRGRIAQIPNTKIVELDEFPIG